MTTDWMITVLRWACGVAGFLTLLCAFAAWSLWCFHKTLQALGLWRDTLGALLAVANKRAKARRQAERAAGRG